jgi:hypothetical protein
MRTFIRIAFLLFLFAVAMTLGFSGSSTPLTNHHVPDRVTSYVRAIGAPYTLPPIMATLLTPISTTTTTAPPVVTTTTTAPPVTQTTQVQTTITTEAPAPVVQTPPPAPVPVSSPSTTAQALAACIRTAENDGNYTWGFPFGTGDGGGAYQFEPSTWIEAAGLAGVTPTTHSPAAQDAAFYALLAVDGTSPWDGDRCVG